MGWPLRICPLDRQNIARRKQTEALSNCSASHRRFGNKIKRMPRANWPPCNGAQAARRCGSGQGKERPTPSKMSHQKRPPRNQGTPRRTEFGHGALREVLSAVRLGLQLPSIFRSFYFGLRAGRSSPAMACRAPRSGAGRGAGGF
jgi:hypothetical protein